MRYKTSGNWKVVDTRQITEYCNGPVVVTITFEVSDAIDTKYGSVHTNGYRRATVKAGSVKKSKSFVGEMAWNDCERWAHDIVWQVSR